MTWSLAVHGGVGDFTRRSLTPGQDAGTRAGLTRAAAAGAGVLSGGGAAVDAVQAAVSVLEDDPHFNAGHGAVFGWDGRNELDAAIMAGTGRRAGAVAGVRRARNPVALARAVMEDGRHVLLAGAGANAFAAEAGVTLVEPDYFYTGAQWEALQRHRANPVFGREPKRGTVGAVARDAHGGLAAATSTGGITGKRWGRVGDSPLVGAGTYADDRAGAVSATGTGEVFIRVGVAAEICARLRLGGMGAQAAADAVLAEVRALGGDGGVIVVGRDGAPVWAFTDAGMNRARVAQGGAVEVAIYGDEG